MSNLTNQILVQNVETFATITRLTVDVESGETATQRIDQYFSKNANWGIVSLDTDADGEYMNVLLVAPVDGPDFMMDMDTGEMEPAEDLAPAAELDAKMDIMMEMDMNDVSQEDILAMLTPEAPVPAPVENIIADPQPSTVTKPKKPRKAKTLTQSGDTMSQPTSTVTPTITGKTLKNHEILAAFIADRPGVKRSDIFQDPGLLVQLRSPAQVQAIAEGDKKETKRWNSCINRFIRKMRRDGTDVMVNGQGKSATYTIGTPSGQLELPFTAAAESRNAAIIGNEADEVVETPIADAKRSDEAPNQNLSFESLLATLDDDNATVTSDDQVAFEAAQKMIK